MGLIDSLGKFVDNIDKTSKKAKKSFDKSTVGKAFKKVNDINQKIDQRIDTAIDGMVDVAFEGAKHVGKGAAKMGRVVSGYEAYDSRKKAKQAKAEADAIKANVEAENNRRREECNRVLKSYGEAKIHALKTCLRPFLDYVEYLGSKYKDKSYDIEGKIHLDHAEIKELESVEMNASTAAKTAAASGVAASIALAGVPTATTTAVMAFATASTGTAISTLSGAAASNAALAWLGGGSLAAGGGGMAAGAAVLSGITYAATGVFALAAAGIVSSAYFSKKYTEATKYLEAVKKFRAEAKLGWAVIDGLNQRAMELESVTHKLEKRIKVLLQYLEPLVYDFQTKDDYYVKTFQEVRMCITSLSQIAQVPLLDDGGNINSKTQILLTDTKRILNRNL